MSYTANNLDQYTAVDAATPTYDGNGNTIPSLIDVRKPERADKMRRAADAHKLIDRHLTAALARLEFVRARPGMYSMPLGPQMTAVITFPEKLWPDTKWDIFPNVGARHDGLNRLLFELSDLPESDRALGLLRANLITNVGYLTPERRFKTWSFPLGSDDQPIVQALVTTIEAYGLPFIRALSDPARFRETLESGRYTLVGQDRDLPTLDVVEGDYVAAEMHLHGGLEKRADRHDPEAEYYRSFATKLRQLIEERKKEL